jgi:hypothetical protein
MDRKRLRRDVPGEIYLNKTAEATGSYGVWQMELSVDAVDLVTRSDVVFGYRLLWKYSGTKFSNEKSAATTFVNNLIVNENSTTNIACKIRRSRYSAGCAGIH